MPTDTIEIKSRSNLKDLETLAKLLQQLSELNQTKLKLPSSFDGEVLSDIWATIFVGTYCRSMRESKIQTWGLSNWTENNRFSHSLAGVVALQMAKSIVTDSTAQNVSTSEVMDAVYKIIQINKGILEPLSGSNQTIMEFDPIYSIAPSFKSKSGMHSTEKILQFVSSSISKMHVFSNKKLKLPDRKSVV